MPKLTYRLTNLTAFLGLLLMIPSNTLKVLFYSKILMIHVLAGVILSVTLISLMYTHVPVELSNPFKRGVKKWNGFKTLLYLILTILSGIIISIFYIHWMTYFHGFIGLWVLLVAWKHKK
ncbi:hypothetical protein [Neobacillus sp. D3-1R]|uniref:hypothetical protein n=1 Tax=Neobacillus sp. D3-1R TaxID=3445778 RepID=UPI003F9F884E